MQSSQNFSLLYNKVKKEIKNSKTKSINLAKLCYLVSYSKNSGYYHENSQNNISDDFITSPLISRFFGYFVGFFLFSKWTKFFYKKEIDLIELGPGTGELCFEILNFIKETEMFAFVKKVKIVEFNDFLKNKQIEKLSILSEKLEFYKDFGCVKFDKPFFLYSNEFFDCLPINQFCFINGEFVETVLFFDEEKDEFFFGFDKNVSNSLFSLNAIENFQKNPPQENQIFEISASIINLNKQINELLNQYCGLNLTIDYGFLKNEYKSNICCIKKHTNCSISDCIKNAGDISFHVNFDHLKQIFCFEEDEDIFFLDHQWIFFQNILEDFKVFLNNKFILENSVEFECDQKPQNDKNFFEILEKKVQSFNKKDSETQIGKLFKVLYKICPLGSKTNF